MPILRKDGITIEVPRADLDFYKRAGYEVVIPEPVKAVEPAKVEPVKKTDDKTAKADK